MGDNFEEISGLLFFDTFSHEVHEDLNLDLVQFPKPVYINEVRIIPLGARVQADFPGGVRLGATNPSKFRIEFFVNDLGKPGASTFESLGGFDYNQNDCINLDCDRKDVRQIPTDGLVLRGFYTTITLAVYGTLTKNITEEIVQPPPPVPSPTPVVVPVVTNEKAPTESAAMEWAAAEEGRPSPTAPPEPPATSSSSSREEYVSPAPFSDTYDATAQSQSYNNKSTYYESHESKRESRHGRDRPITGSSGGHDRDSSESDWDRDEREELNKRRDVDRSPERTSNRDQVVGSSTHRSDTTRTYSRSSSKDREHRGSRTSGRQRTSSDYRHSRYSSRNSSSQYERSGKKEKSRDQHDRRSSDKEHECKRPRTPPIDSPKRPKTPEQSAPSTPPPPPSPVSKSTDDKLSTKYSAMEKGQPIRVIDNTTTTSSTTTTTTTIRDKSKPPSPLTPAPAEQSMENSPIAAEDETMSQGEPFEPILSDEEIGEETESQFDMDCDVNDFNDDIIKPFIPGVTILESWSIDPSSDESNNADDGQPAELEMCFRLMKKYQAKNLDQISRANFDTTAPEHREIWVNTAEQLIQLLLAVHNLDTIQRNRMLTIFCTAHINLLVEWIKIGIDFQCVMLQPKPGYKIRHLKIGARLTESLGCQSDIMQRLLIDEKVNIFQELFDLYNQSHMALSIKLMLIKAIYSCLDAKVAIDYFINDGKETGYQHLINAIQANPLTRVKFALKSLLNKVTIYETLQFIRDQAINASNDSDTNNMLLTAGLNQILNAFTIDEQCYAQPKRFLPVAAKFEIVKDPASTRSIAQTFYSHFRSTAFIESIVLLTIYTRSEPFTLCIRILDQLTEKTIGLDVLANNIDATNLLVRILLNAPQPSNDKDAAVTTDSVTDSTTADTPGPDSAPVAAAATVVAAESFSPKNKMFSNYVAIKIAYKMKAKYLLTVMAQPTANEGIIIDALHDLYSLTCNPYGRIHVTNTIAMDNNIMILLNIIEKYKQPQHQSQQQQQLDTPSTTSTVNDKIGGPIIGYAVDLIDITIRICIRINYLENAANHLIDLVKNNELFESTLSMQLQEIGIYLKPFELANVFSYDNITPLCELLKRNVEFVQTFPGDLIMTMRILYHLAIPASDTDELPEYAELKYKYIILQLYSNDGIAVLLSILEKINQHFEQPDMHVSTLIGQQGVLVTHIILPAIHLLQKMLTFVIQSRNTQYKDLTGIEQLVKTYILMHHYTDYSLAYSNTRQIQRLIIQTLLAYTQPSPIDGSVESPESVHKSLWTQMIGELLKQCLIGPRTFEPGLIILHKLLPKPLPLHVQVPLTVQEVNRLKTERQLWSAHLHAKSALLTELIQTICTSSDYWIQTIFNYLCIQLINMAPNTALLVIRAIVDVMVNDADPPGTVTPQAMQLFRFIYGLALKSCGKIAVNASLPGKFVDFLCGILTVAQPTPLCEEARELVVNLLNILLDPEQVTTFWNRIKFTSVLPPKEVLPLIVNSVIDLFMVSEYKGYMDDQLNNLLRIFAGIDYTLFLMRAVLEKKKDSVRLWLDKKLNWQIVEDRYKITCIILFFDSLIHYLDDEHTIVRQRQYHLRVIDLMSIVGWTSTSSTSTDEEQIHPFVRLEKQFSEDSTNHERVLKKLRKMIKKMKANPTDELDLLKSNFIPPDSIATQYNERKIFHCDELRYEKINRNFDRHTNSINLAGTLITNVAAAAAETSNSIISRTTIPLPDVSDDKNTIDLMELIKSNLPTEFNVISECKRLLHLSASPQSNRERTATAPCFRTRRVEVEPTTGRPEKKIYVTRGRGFARTPQTRGDLFRSRPPNTSRPPSLHVDDFLALETCGAQPTGPTGYNKLSREMIGIRGSRGGRGRGGGGGFSSDRGRLASLSSNASPGNSYRQSLSSRTNSPSTWQGHGSGGGSDTPGQHGQHFRTATTEPMAGHFQGEYSSGGGHFSGTPQRGRMRGNSRPPRTFTR